MQRDRERRRVPAMSGAAVHVQRRAERRLVQKARRSAGAAQLDRSRDDGAEQLLARPQFAPPGVGEARSEFVVAIVLPAA